MKSIIRELQDQNEVVLASRLKKVLAAGIPKEWKKEYPQIKSWGSMDPENLNRRYSWFLKARVKDAEIDYDAVDDRFYWHNGTWLNGTWKGGVWLGGTWETGTWLKGTWKGGVWKNGTWKNGTWEKGTWNNGTWKNGTWKKGLWKKGLWLDGTWENGIWKGGEWEYGSWRNGTWKGGTWYEGYWHGGTWEKGLIAEKRTRKLLPSKESPFVHKFQKWDFSRK